MPTTPLFTTIVHAVIPSSDLASLGTAQVMVVDAPLDFSNTVDFQVTGNDTPAITNLSPTTAIMGSPGFTLTVNGSGFEDGATVDWNGNPLSTSFVGSTQLTAAVPAGDIASTGTASVTVADPNGHTSTAATFTITAAAAPTVTSIDPNTAQAGSAAIDLTVTGTGFTSSSVVEWGGSALATSFVSATQLGATIPVGDLGSPTTVQVGVNDPQGGPSNTVPFTITPATGTIVHTFSAGLQLFSAPMDYTGMSLGSIFDQSVTLAVWNPSAVLYAVTPTPPADHIAQGQAYWCNFAQATDLIKQGTDLGAGQSTFSIPLSVGWNMVGDPSSSSIALSGVMVVEGASSVPFGSSNAVSPNVWAYDPSSNAYTVASSLDPWVGYWVFANQACTLSVPLP